MQSPESQTSTPIELPPKREYFDIAPRECTRITHAHSRDAEILQRIQKERTFRDRLGAGMRISHGSPEALISGCAWRQRNLIPHGWRNLTGLACGLPNVEVPRRRVWRRAGVFNTRKPLTLLEEKARDISIKPSMLLSTWPQGRPAPACLCFLARLLFFEHAQPARRTAQLAENLPIGTHLTFDYSERYSSALPTLVHRSLARAWLPGANACRASNNEAFLERGRACLLFQLIKHK
jgi:hypothetical protein